MFCMKVQVKQWLFILCTTHKCTTLQSQWCQKYILQDPRFSHCCSCLLACNAVSLGEWFSGFWITVVSKHQKPLTPWHIQACLNPQYLTVPLMWLKLDVVDQFLRADMNLFLCECCQQNKHIHSCNSLLEPLLIGIRSVTKIWAAFCFIAWHMMVICFWLGGNVTKCSMLLRLVSLPVLHFMMDSSICRHLTDSVPCC